MKSPTAMMTIPAIVKSDKAMLYLKDLNTFGISIKKFENSTSFEVAPQDMSMLNM